MSADQNTALSSDLEPITMSAPGGEVVQFPGTVPPAPGLSAEDYGDLDLIESYGKPAYFARNKDGDVHVTNANENYWAADYDKKHTILFEQGEKIFYQYEADTGLYEPISEAAIRRAISASMLDFSRLHEDLEDLEKKRTAGTLSAVVRQLRGIVEARDAFVNRIMAIHLKNRMLFFPTMATMLPVPFSPIYRSRNQSPIIYYLAATCPRFLGELVGPAVSAGDLLILQKMAGQFLLGRNPAQRILLLDGEAGRGKTQFVNVIRSIVGAHNTAQLRTELLGQRFETSRFLGRTLLVGSDVNPGFLAAPGAEVLKALVGGDLLDAEKKGGNEVFRFKGDFNVVIVSNAQLKVKLQGDIGAWRRRMVIVRYEAPAPKIKIPNFAELLVKEEGSGIINWCLEGLKLLMDDIRQTGDIRMPADQTTRVDTLLDESDSLRNYLRANVRRTDGSDLTVSELITAYADFCVSKDWTPIPEWQFQRQLPSLMLELFQTPKSNDCRRDGKAARGYHKVGFCPEA